MLRDVFGCFAALAIRHVGGTAVPVPPSRVIRANRRVDNGCPPETHGGQRDAGKLTYVARCFRMFFGYPVEPRRRFTLPLMPGTTIPSLP
jgi:hypothetical protein